MEDWIFKNIEPYWIKLPYLIKWQINEREHLEKENKNQLVDSINASIIFNSSCILEGYFFELIQTVLHIQRFKYPKNKIITRIIELQSKNLENSGIFHLMDFIESISNIKLSQITSNDLWESVRTLIKFRNLIAHVKSLEVDFYTASLKNKPKPAISKKYKEIHSYLVKNKLPKVRSDFYSISDIINSQVADFFYSQSTLFIKEINDVFIEKKEFKKHLRNIDDLF